MIEEQLEKLRKEYIAVNPPSYLSQNGWAELSPQLRPLVGTHYPFLFTRGLALAAIIVLVLSAVWGSSQLAKPGQALYPVKILSDTVVAKVTGNIEFKIQRRAQEVIDQSAKPNGGFEEATKQYQQTLQETKEEAKKEGKSQEFKKTLDENEQDFRNAQQQHPSSQNDLEKVIKHTKEAKGEVQGQKDEKWGKDNQNGNQNNDNHGNHQGRDD